MGARILERMNIASLIFSKAAPDAVAFAGLGESTLTYKSVEKCVASLAAQLRRAGFGHGDRLALSTPRGPLGLISFLSLSSVATCCPLDPRLKDDEFEAALDGLSVKALVDATGEPRLAALAKRKAIELLRPDFAEISSDASGSDFAGHVSAATSAEDIALLLQTSGTTSKPKLVALTHSNILGAARAIGTAYRIGAEDLCLNPMPHYHVHGLISAGLSSLVAGAAQYCVTSFSAAAFETALDALRPTWFTGSPAFHLGLLDHFKFAGTKPRNARLRFIRSSSGPFPESMIGAYEDLFGVPLLENYGMTETSSTICSNPLPPGKRKAGSVGVALGAEIRIADAEGRDMRPGEAGEILLKGPSVISSYASEDANRGNFFESWLRTGDIGRFDEDHYLFVLGRSKELIKRGGHSVYPLEVDSAILAYPSVAEALCFALPHPTLGEELVAVVVPRPGKSATAGDLRDFLQPRLSTYKIPIAFYSVAEIPKNDTGKAVRRDMAKTFEHLLAPKAAPATSPLEGILLQTWLEVLGRTDIGVSDNLFIFGADTLRAQRACDLIAVKMGIKLDLKTMLRNPTVRGQLPFLLQHDGAAAPDDKISR
jgi:oxalate---CoA ligase